MGRRLECFLHCIIERRRASFQCSSCDNITNLRNKMVLVLEMTRSNCQLILIRIRSFTSSTMSGMNPRSKVLKFVYLMVGILSCCDCPCFSVVIVSVGHCVIKLPLDCRKKGENSAMVALSSEDKIRIDLHIEIDKRALEQLLQSNSKMKCCIGRGMFSLDSWSAHEKRGNERNY